MNREKAIEIFKRLKENAPNEMHLETVGTAQELFDMAIQALSQEPCDDAISREDRLIDLANAIESDDSGYWTNKRISSVLRNIPSVTQKCEKCAMNGSGSKYCDNCGQKSGKWIDRQFQSKIDGEIRNGWECSECGERFFRYDLVNTDEFIPKYCPNCGAKMESENKDL